MTEYILAESLLASLEKIGDSIPPSKASYMLVSPGPPAPLVLISTSFKGLFKLSAIKSL